MRTLGQPKLPPVALLSRALLHHAMVFGVYRALLFQLALQAVATIAVGSVVSHF